MTTDLLANRLNHSENLSVYLDNQRFANQQSEKYSTPKLSTQISKEIGTQFEFSDLGKPLVNPNSTAATQKLLDGAIVAAIKATSLKTLSPPMTRLRWIWALASAYHLTHFYPLLIEEAAQHFATKGREDLVQWALQKAQEEQKHDQLALLDIHAMGYKAEAVVAVLIPPVAASLVNYLTQEVRSSNPIGCVGYSYTMERLATGIRKNHIQSVENLLPQNIDATRCLRTHSSVGSDVKHVEETAVMIAGLNSKERNQIAIACYETTLLFLSSPKEDDILEEELQRVLQPLRLDTSVTEY